jgi:Cys-rich protein (TIGR01571 family)
MVFLLAGLLRSCLALSGMPQNLGVELSIAPEETAASMPKVLPPGQAFNFFDPRLHADASPSTEGARGNRTVPSSLIAMISNTSKNLEQQVVELAGTSRYYFTYHAYFWHCFVTWVIWLVLAFLVVQGCYVRGMVPGRNPKAVGDPEITLKSGQFDCLSDVNIFVCSVICLPIRWADTVSMAHMLGFWPAFSAFAVLGLLNHVCFLGVYTWGALTACIMFFYRQQLRKKLSLTPWSYDFALLDGCYVLFCPFCAVAQEARMVKEAYEKGHDGFA